MTNGRPEPARRLTTRSSANVRVHLYFRDRTVCGVTTPPDQWPDGHCFVRWNPAREVPPPVNCPECLAKRDNFLRV